MTLRRLAVVLVLAVPVLALGGAVAVVLAPASDVSPQEPVDAVIALAGDAERLRLADEIAGSAGGQLVLSWVPESSSARDEWCYGDGGQGHAMCFVPVPTSTAGEARAVGELADEQGWERLLVVTSRHHVGRARMLVEQCVDGAQVRVVSATERRATASDVVEEALGVLAGATALRAC